MSLNDDIKRLYEENKRNPLAWLLVAVAFLMLMGTLWPLYIMAPGAALIYAAYNGDRRSARMIFPGLIIGGTGAILLYQSITGHWESWAYAWALYPTLVGLGMQFVGQRTDDQREVRQGQQIIRKSLMAFAGLALFFELLIFGSISAWLLLAAGIALLWWQGHIKIGDKAQDTEYRQKVRRFVEDKRKHVQIDDEPVVEKRKHKPSSVSDDLRERINEAIREADDEASTDTQEEPAPAKNSHGPVE